MKLLSRIARICRADLHGVMDQLENRDLLLKQYLREMKESLQRKEVALQQLAADLHQNESRQQETVQQIDTTEEDITLALRKDKDRIARMLIRQQIDRKKLLDHLQKTHTELRQKEEELSSLLARQRLVYSSMKARAATTQHHEMVDREIDNSDASGDLHEHGADDTTVELELIRRKEALQKTGDVS